VTPPDSTDQNAPLFKRARYRTMRQRAATDETLPPLDPYDPYELSDFDDLDDDTPDDDNDDSADSPRFWTSNRLIMLILALIVLITLLAYDLQGVIIPPPPTDTAPLIDPLVWTRIMI